MRNNQRSKRGVPYGKIVIILLVISIAFGFLFDWGCNLIDKKTHPLRYTEFIEKYSEKYKVPKALVYAVIKNESDFESNAVSPVGAIGLMQLMPSTFEDITKNFLSENLETGMLYDPETNIKYGVFYLSWLKTFYDDWNCVLAAYNGGLGNVNNWLKDEEYSEDGKTLIIDKIPFKETRNYVKKVNKAEEKYEKLYFTED